MFVRPVQFVQAVGQWHVQSHEVARRNAFVASAVLAERRREREEVERFLAARALPRPSRASVAASDPPAVKARTRQGA